MCGAHTATFGIHKIYQIVLGEHSGMTLREQWKAHIITRKSKNPHLIVIFSVDFAAKSLHIHVK